MMALAASSCCCSVSLVADAAFEMEELAALYAAEGFVSREATLVCCVVSLESASWLVEGVS